MDYILCHHGIKGQKWYQRRFQRKDGTLTKAGRKRYAKEMEEKGLSGLSDEYLRSRVNRARLENRYNELYAPDNVSAGQKKTQKMLETAGAVARLTGNAATLKTKLSVSSGETDQQKLESYKNLKSNSESASKTINKLMEKNKQVMDKANRNKPRLDVSDKTDDELRKMIERRDLENQYKSYYYSKEKVKSGHDKVMSFLEVAGGVMVAAGTAVELVSAIKKLKNKD